MSWTPRTRRRPLAGVRAAIGASGCLVLLAMPVQARPARVILLEPAATASGLHHCLTRIRQELAAGGFEVVTVDPGPKTDPMSIANEMARQPEAVATFAVLGDRDARPSELWILDRIGGHADVVRIRAQTDDPDHVPEVFAIRAIETLRASALKLLVESNRPPSPTAPTPAPSVVTVAPAAPSRTRSDSAAIETGLLLVASPGGLGPAVLPLARLRIKLLGPLFARLSLAGLGSRPRVETAKGSASVGQALVLVELGGLFRSAARLRPMVGLGAGLLRVDSDGEGIWPYQGTRQAAWAAAVDGGLGVLAETGAHSNLALVLEAHAFLALPHPYVRFVDTNAATVGRPALTVALTLVVRL